MNRKKQGMFVKTVIKRVLLHDGMCWEVTENTVRWIGWDEITGHLNSHTE